MSTPGDGVEPWVLTTGEGRCTHRMRKGEGGSCSVRSNEQPWPTELGFQGAGFPEGREQEECTKAPLMGRRHFCVDNRQSRLERLPLTKWDSSYKNLKRTLQELTLTVLGKQIGRKFRN